jgi:hypothetical protein
MMRPIRTIRTGRVAFVTTATAAVLCFTPAADGGPVPVSATLTASGQQDAVLSGVVVRDGVPVEGARVDVAAWPDSQVIDGMRIGQPADFHALPQVVTDEQGRFVVSVSPTTLPGKFVEPGGRVQWDVIVDDGASLIDWDFSNRSAPADQRFGASASDGQEGGAAPTAVRFEFGSDPAVVVASVSEANSAAGLARAMVEAREAVSVQPSRIPRRLPGSGAAEPASSSCHWVVADTKHGVSERFAHVYPGAGAPVYITQSVGAEHSIGIATGFAGKWHGGRAGGSVTIDSSASATLRAPGNRTAWDRVNMKKWSDLCGHYQWRAYSVHSLLTGWTKKSEPRFTSCARYPKGAQLVKTHGKNFEFNGGVDVGPVAVDSRAGFSTHTKLVWHVKTPTWLCGSTDQGWASSPEAEADTP